MYIVDNVKWIVCLGRTCFCRPPSDVRVHRLGVASLQEPVCYWPVVGLVCVPVLAPGPHLLRAYIHKMLQPYILMLASDTSICTDSKILFMWRQNSRVSLFSLKLCEGDEGLGTYTYLLTAGSSGLCQAGSVTVVTDRPLA